jgi:hypothetical protein
MKLDLKQLALITKELNELESTSENPDMIHSHGVASSTLQRMVEHLLFAPEFDYDEEVEIDDQALNTEIILTELIKLEIIKLD